ncbi:uncharacterized protein ACLA_099170 [Aspergillus clavatus NRRL 1]|uniref:AMP-dependent synthetase/ligase domain-containing protein n=1 Tax=Aspergillus clavatus (strain ATCC 1007 / CBS 513.65 / DSM 816 / NCTC 3887 / NRRL 1 / QM 1276 / 107) TaxID=344612 RepID=A1CN36_ASPCL|nr:uncharacterized protein ACLA_099170 [Aspergillus clavatus NRRL 1]EAW08973.1 hypothetical protein ACLA_099170 [Aspergillus clavatus NRRL 1]
MELAVGGCPKHHLTQCAGSSSHHLGSALHRGYCQPSQSQFPGQGLGALPQRLTIKRRSMRLFWKRQKAGLSAERIIVVDDARQDVWQTNASSIPDDDFNRPHIPPITNPEKEVAVLVYSSGTASLSKGVMLSHYNIVANLLQAEAVDTSVLTHRDTALAFLPFLHIMGLSFLINYSFYIGTGYYRNYIRIRILFHS